MLLSLRKSDLTSLIRVFTVSAFSKAVSRTLLRTLLGRRVVARLPWCAPYLGDSLVASTRIIATNHTFHKECFCWPRCASRPCCVLLAPFTAGKGGSLSLKVYDCDPPFPLQTPQTPENSKTQKSDSKVSGSRPK